MVRRGSCACMSLLQRTNVDILSGRDWGVPLCSVWSDVRDSAWWLWIVAFAFFRQVCVPSSVPVQFSRKYCPPYASLTGVFPAICSRPRLFSVSDSYRYDPLTCRAHGRLFCLSVNVPIFLLYLWKTRKMPHEVFVLKWILIEVNILIMSLPICLIKIYPGILLTYVTGTDWSLVIWYRYICVSSPLCHDRWVVAGILLFCDVSQSLIALFLFSSVTGLLFFKPFIIYQCAFTRARTN